VSEPHSLGAAGLFVLARCIGFAFRAPGFSHPSVPAPLRAGLAFLLAIAIAPNVHGVVPPDGIAFVLAIAIEFGLGSAIGMAAGAVYDGAYAGGRAIDDYVGVKAIAPSLQLVAPSGFGRVWSLAFTGGYFLLGTYRYTLLAFAQSFRHMPPGAAVGAHGLGAYAAGTVGTVVLTGLVVAAPAIGLAFVTHVALGALSRAVPRFGSFTLTFPLAFAAALLATVLALAQSFT
jgi:flagellar biosynthetic protein FliR